MLDSRSPSASWSYPTSVQIGAGCVSSLTATCERAGIRRPLLVTDPGLVGLAAFDLVRAAMPPGTPVFSDIRPNPVGADVEAGVEVFRAGGHDGVVAVGGGSALDVGKVIAFQSGQSRSLWDFEDIGDNWALANESTIAPVVAVPTTAGTGSELGRAGVVIDEASARKVIVFHPKMLPVAVLADPELTVGLPRVLTVGTGIDALSHSLEAVCAPAYHPMSHGIALEGIRLVLEHLPRVAADPADLESRTHMMAAASMGAVAFQKGLGGMHALSHPIGALHDTHHGMTNAVVMPYVLAANRPAIVAPLDRVAAYVGVEGGFDGFLEHVLELRTSLDVPHSLGELGVDGSRVDEIVAGAVDDPSAAGNPVPFTEAFARSVLTDALNGTLRSPV